MVSIRCADNRSMAHLPYADPRQPALRPLVDRIVAERGSVLHLYQMLLHSPPLAEGWLGFLTQVRQHLSLSGALRELVILRVAGLNGAPYEAEQHAPLALKEGVTREQLDALQNWRASDAFTPLQRAVLRLTDTMTRDVQVPAGLVHELRTHLDERQVVELVGTIAAYNMVSRFLEALQIHSGDVPPGPAGQ
jgi:AhpD family alkylhydroperoxidase